MSKPVRFRWRFWNNPNFITLECSDSNIWSISLVSYTRGETDGRVDMKTIGGSTGKPREELAKGLLYATLIKKEFLIKKVVFHPKGLDIDLDKNRYDPADLYKIMPSIEKVLRGVLADTQVEFEFPA